MGDNSSSIYARQRWHSGPLHSDIYGYVRADVRGKYIRSTYLFARASDGVMQNELLWV